MSNVVVGQIPHNVIMRSNLLRRDNPPYEVYTPQHLLYNHKKFHTQFCVRKNRRFKTTVRSFRPSAKKRFL